MTPFLVGAGLTLLCLALGALVERDRKRSKW